VGFQGILEDCAELVQTFPNELGGGDIDVAGMRKDLADYTALAEQRASLAKELALVEDTLQMLGSRVWSQEMTIYARGRTAARTNVNVKRAIEPIERFMKHGPHKKVAPPSTPSTLSTPNTSGGTVT
jgi:hypothetical protein